MSSITVRQQMMWAFLLLFATSVICDEAVKNHRAEKRQDNDFVLFGGWQPIKPGNPYYHRSLTGKYHDIISALPGSLDAASNFYKHALPSNYHKDIYNYYPRPAIKPRPKKNTPVYMERYKPQQPKQVTPRPLVDIQQLDLNRLREFQEIVQRAKELPLTQLNLQQGKPVEFIHVSVQPLQQSSFNRKPQGNNKGYSVFRQPSKPRPVHYQYLPAQSESVIPPQLPPIKDVIGIKDIQIIEVALPPVGGHGDQRQQASFQSKPYFPQSQPRAQPKQSKYVPPQQHHHQQPQVEAEFVKLSDHEIKTIFNNLQVMDKTPEDLLKYIPVSDVQKTKPEDLQIVLAVPQMGQEYDGKSGIYSEAQQYMTTQQGRHHQYGHSHQEAYEQNTYESSDKEQGHSYIEVMTPHVDENGYRREPVLAVELKEGQTVEDAIKSLDPETLQRLGAHGKDGLEIEVVEVPVDDYSTSESRKMVTIVSSSNNSTTMTTAKKT